MSLPTLDIKNNYYVVKVGLLYNYYSIKIKPFTEEEGIIRFEKAPPVIMEGVAIVNRKLYHVTPQDLLRGVIRKYRELAVPAKREKVNGKSESTRTSTVRETLQHPVKSGTGSETELEIVQAADNAWSEQIGALLDIIAEKEGVEFEISDSA